MYQSDCNMTLRGTNLHNEYSQFFKFNYSNNKIKLTSLEKHLFLH